jgi:hypothetical protein
MDNERRQEIHRFCAEHEQYALKVMAWTLFVFGIGWLILQGMPYLFLFLITKGEIR